METTQKNQEFGTILRACIDAKGYSNKDFADLSGLKANTLSNYLNNVSRPNFETLVSFTKILGVSSDYLLGIDTQPTEGHLKGHPKGHPIEKDKTKRINFEKNLTHSEENEETKGTNFEMSTSTGRLRVLVTTVDAAGRDNIALVGTRVAAGYAQHGFFEPEFLRDLPTFSLPDSAYRNGTFRAFQVAGDSMQPTLYEGDWVICRYVEDWASDIRDTFVYVVVTNDRPVVKRVLNRLFERGQLTLQSDNPVYPAQFVEGEEVKEVWQAVGRLSRQFVNPRYDLVQEMSRTRADVDELLARITAIEASKSH